MISAQLIYSLTTLLVIFGTCVRKENSLKPRYHSTLSSFNCTRTLDPKLQDIQFMTVTRHLNTLSYRNRTRYGKMHSLLYISMLLITASSDVELNPGPRPPKYPCQICCKAVTWKQKGVACDDCQQWYHTQCMHMNSHTYEQLCNYSNLSWHCVNCGMPNFSTSLFESFIIDSSKNTFSSLDSTINSTTSSLSPGPPVSCSSPIQAKKKNPTPSQRSLKILNINFQSCKNKKEEIANLLDSSDPSIIIGTETWLNPNIYSPEIFSPAYNVLRRDRVDGYGGVMLALKNDLIFEELETGTDTEQVFAKITLDKNKTLIIGSVYRPPNSDSNYSESLSKTIEDIRNRFKNAVMWIGGDLNLPDINWGANTIEGNQNSNRINSIFLEVAESCNLHQMVTQPTRNNNILDIFFTNRPTLITRSTTLPGLGDHDIVFIETSASAKRAKPVKRLVHLWKNADIDALKLKCTNFQREFLKNNTTTNNVNTMWNDIKVHLLEILDSCVPSKLTSSRFNQPWINRDIKRMSHKKKRAYKKAKQNKTAKNTKRYEQLKAETKNACKKAYNDYIRNIISPDSQSNPKKFYSFIKSKKTESQGVAPLKDHDGITYSDSKTKANILNEQFSSVFNKDEDASSIPDMGPSPHQPMQDIYVTVNGIQKILSNLDPHKATGPDKLPARLLKELATEISPVYRLFFQASLDQGVVPDDWKSANVVPIFKKGDRSKAVNYRPVSLTSITCKVLEHIVTSSIMTHLDKNNILTDAQHGFRKRRSCETQLIQTVQDLAKNIDMSGQTDVILLDFSKAFDKVPHQRLLTKIKFYGVGSHLHKWIGSFLGDRHQTVYLDGHESSQARVQSGVPQGSVLGPLLFLLFINDLPEYISPESTVRLFADDCALYRNIKSEKDAIALQKDLEGLQKWEKDWMMEFHPQKCQVLHITKKRKPIKLPYIIHGHTLDEVNTAKYLGLNFEKSLNWNHHINTITKKANNARSFLQRNIHQCPKQTKELCYLTLVRPLLEYSAIIWDPFTEKNIRKIEMVQRRSARMIFSDYRQTSSVSSMLQQLQWPSLRERRAQAKVTMMYRIVYHLVEVPTTHLVPISSTRGHGLNYLVPFARTQTYQCSFFPDTIRLWNSLPQTAVNSATVESFKGEVQKAILR